MPQRDKDQYNNYQRAYQLARYHRRRSGAVILLGSKCALCGSCDSVEIDHIDPQNKSFDIAKLWSISEEKFLAELSKCQLLCKRCHSIKTSLESTFRRPITHGLYWAAYKHKCSCTLCLQYRKDNAALRRAKRAKP